MSEHSHSAPVLLRDDNSGITVLTLNRPRKFNALSEELLASLAQNLDEIKANRDIRVVVLKANGKAFCAGHDLGQMRANTDPAYIRSLFSRCSSVMQKIVQLPQPVIASVQGMATAAGCQLAATCDLAIAGEDSQFAVSGINIGLFCSTPAVALSRNIARKHAMEMLITGDFIDAPTAEKYGLVNRVVPARELDAAVMAMAEKIARKLPSAVMLGKALFYKQLNLPLGSAYDVAADAITCNFLNEETLEGVDAFLEKRAPDWEK